jgi:hypothetical protein
MSSMKYPYRELGVTFDRQFRNDLNANFDDIEHDIRMIGGEAAQQALEAAHEAETQAIYAQQMGDYAEEKGDYAAQQGDYARVQGDAASLAVNNANNALAVANDAVNNANTAVENANIAIANANNAAASANDAAANANSAATNANNAADNANTQATNAQIAAQTANNAAQAANQAAANANEAADNANTAAGIAQDIIDNTRYIEPYNPDTTYYKNNIVSYNGSSFIAKQTTTGNTPIGDANDPYWGLLAQRGVDGQGSVSSVNNKYPDVNGNVTITAVDVDASPSNHTHPELHIHDNKTVLDGLSDDEGKLLYNGMPVSSVTSVNGQTGDVNLTAVDVGAVSQEDFVAHTADTTKHVTQAEKDAWNAAQAKVNDLEILYWMGAI